MKANRTQFLKKKSRPFLNSVDILSSWVLRLVNIWGKLWKSPTVSISEDLWYQQDQHKLAKIWIYHRSQIQEGNLYKQLFFTAEIFIKDEKQTNR